MKFEVDEGLIEPIIREKIAAAVVAQLGSTDELVSKMVQLALNQKTQSNGVVSQYSSDNKFSFIEAIAGNTIRQAAKDAIVEIVEQQKPAIQAAIQEQLQRAPKKTAAAIIGAFCDAAKNEYRITANFVFEDRN